MTETIDDKISEKYTGIATIAGGLTTYGTAGLFAYGAFNFLYYNGYSTLATILGTGAGLVLGGILGSIITYGLIFPLYKLIKRGK